MSYFELDARRLLCPLPVIRLQEKINTLSAGDEIRLQATDPGVKFDIPAWCRIHGHEIISMDEQDELISFHIGVRL